MSCWYSFSITLSHSLTLLNYVLIKKKYLIKVIEFLDFTPVTIDCESPFEEVTVNGTTIMSTNFLYDYENSTDCQVTIRFATDQVVAISLEVFNVEESDDGECDFDYLVVYDGNSTGSSKIGPKLCDVGNKLAGITLRSTGNEMTLHFSADNLISRRGFRIFAYAGKK